MCGICVRKPHFQCILLREIKAWRSSIYKSPLCFEVLYAKEYFKGEVEKEKFNLKYYIKNLSGRPGDVFFYQLFCGKFFIIIKQLVKIRNGYEFLGWVYYLLLYVVYVLYGFYCIFNNKNFIIEFVYELHLRVLICVLIDLVICNYYEKKFLKNFKEVLEIK